MDLLFELSGGFLGPGGIPWPLQVPGSGRTPRTGRGGGSKPAWSSRAEWVQRSGSFRHTLELDSWDCLSCLSQVEFGSLCEVFVGVQVWSGVEGNDAIQKQVLKQ